MNAGPRLKVVARDEHTRRVLFESLGVRVVDFRCHAHRAPADGPEEPNPTHSIVFVRRGVFRRTARRESVLADPNHVMLFNAAEPYRYAHPLPGGDACTILAVEPDRALELVGRHAPAAAEHPERPFGRGSGLSSPRAVWLHWEFLNLVARGADGLALEDALAELSREAIACVYAAPELIRTVGASRARRRRRDLVEAAKLMVSERLARPPSLGELADALDCSPYQLSHTFHDVAGLSLRRYVGRLRARCAAERLAAGASRLTPLALDLGYADHSHFTNAFRREWGVSPSAFRARHGAWSSPPGYYSNPRSRSRITSSIDGCP